ncbi:MAG: LacI family DNA-binding transcriptional regulator [Spirochaetes bacterium]|nr:LacI family DNA-binding transcriptional regulator [Spirochaetota bacterium]
MATMIDVAKKAGVSLSTVSYVLNGTRPISEKTKAVVHKAMEELGYNPNALARGLAGKNTRIIAVLCPIEERGIGMGELEVLSGAADAARKRGYHLVLWTYPLQEPEELKNLIRQELVDGVIVMEVHENDPRIDTLLECNEPFCMIGRCSNAPDIGYIDINFKQTVKDAIDHLYQLGHRNIAFINQSKETFDSGYGPSVRTQHFFMEEMQKLDLTPVSEFCHAAPAEAYEITKSLLDKNTELTSLIVMNDRAISGIMQALSERNIIVPDDFSLISIVTSSRTSELFMPQLTSVDYDGQAMGEVAVEQLINELEEKQVKGEKVLLPLQLIKRKSTAICRIKR